jgi:diguanylate cyclase (GGDEF)-like protein
MPLVQVKEAAENIAAGRLEDEPQVVGATDEIQDLTQSLKKISRNAKELLEKVEKLSLKDKLTGLYNATYIRERLDEEIQRAIYYQRPCSFAYIMIKNYDEITAKSGEEASEGTLKMMAGVLNGQMSEFDRAARIGRGEFAIIFPDKNKKKCIELMEKIRQESPKDLSVCIGISENPIDGVDADSLYVKAQDRMKVAHRSGKPLEAFI